MGDRPKFPIGSKVRPKDIDDEESIGTVLDVYSDECKTWDMYRILWNDGVESIYYEHELELVESKVE